VKIKHHALPPEVWTFQICRRIRAAANPGRSRLSAGFWSLDIWKG